MGTELAEEARLIEFANQIVWKSPDLNLLRRAPVEEYPALSRVLQDQLQRSHARGKLFLPDLRAFRNGSVGVFSDYGGEGSGNYHTYSALVCGYGYTGPFTQKMKAVREAHGLGEKEIAFKDFGMGPVRRALPDYLTALNALPGFLCALVVDKKLSTVFGSPRNDSLARLLEAEKIGQWKAGVAEKLLRVVHFAAFLTALLTHDGQKVFWMSDHDAICANTAMHQQMLVLFQRVLTLYTRPGCTFPLVGGAVPFEQRTIEMLDLLSAADVAAGCIEHYFTKRDSVSPDEIRMKAGSEEVLRWLAFDGIGLKKATFVLRPGKAGMIEQYVVEFNPVNPPATTTVIPIFM
jgi:hypothetical protein